MRDLEEIPEHGHIQGFAKPAGTGEKYDLISLYNFTNQERLIYKVTSLIYELFKIISPYLKYRYPSHLLFVICA